MGKIFEPTPTERAKWRAQANAAAEKIKAGTPDPTGKEELKIGFAFDDGFVSVKLATSLIERSTAKELADILYVAVTRTADEENEGGGLQ